MLILEVAGTFEPQTLQALLIEGETFEHYPYAVLGDFSLRIHMDRDTERADALLDGLQQQGYEVIGYRWKREVPSIPARRVVSVDPVPALEPWYVRLFGGRKRPVTH